MERSILDSTKDPLGAMLLDYWNGRKKAFVTVDSSLLEMSQMSGRIMFRQVDQMSSIEHQALALCRGKILDVGAGSGCHSLYLQEQDQEVVALDISPGCIEVIEKRQVGARVHNSLFNIKNQYDTLAYYAAFHGWQCDRIMEDGEGKYLVRIY